MQISYTSKAVMSHCLTKGSCHQSLRVKPTYRRDMTKLYHITCCIGSPSINYIIQPKTSFIATLELNKDLELISLIQTLHSTGRNHCTIDTYLNALFRRSPFSALGSHSASSGSSPSKAVGERGDSVLVSSSSSGGGVGSGLLGL